MKDVISLVNIKCHQTESCFEISVNVTHFAIAFFSISFIFKIYSNGINLKDILSNVIEVHVVIAYIDARLTVHWNVPGGMPVSMLRDIFLSVIKYYKAIIISQRM